MSIKKPLSPDRVVPKVGLSPEEAAWSLGISVAKMYRMISEGQIPVAKIGHNSIVDPEDLRELMKKHRTVKNKSERELDGPNMVQSGTTDRLRLPGDGA